MEYTGKIMYIGPVEVVGKNNMEKQEIVLEEVTDREYKGSLCVAFLKDKVSMMKDYKKGDEVKVYLNARSNEYNGKHYNSITVWKIESTGGQNHYSENTTQNTPEDDLPF